MKNLIGAVLCGGKSSRMGMDKGLILSDNKPWAKHQLMQLETLELPSYISINPQQKEFYLPYFDADTADTLILDETNIPGPINGLMSVHQKFPEKDILLLACDMQEMQLSTLQTLINAYTENESYEFYAHHHRDFWEPLCAIYTAKGLERLNKELHQTHDHSFQHLLNEGNCLKLAVQHPESFKNSNKNSSSI